MPKKPHRFFCEQCRLGGICKYAGHPHNLSDGTACQADNMIENPHNFSCFNCPVRALCKYEGSPYNTYGDCLAEK